MVNGELPDGWTVKRLIDVGRLLRGVSYRKEDSSETQKKGLVPILRATNIQNEKLILDNELVYVPSDYIKPEQYLRPNDIVVCMSSGSKHLVGKTAQLTQEWMGSFGTFCAAIRPTETVNSKLVGYFFSSPYYRDFIREKSAGININNLKPTDFETIEIPIPPLPEQERIVAKIEELFTQLEAGTSALERVKVGLRRYKASVLQAAVDGKLLENGQVENGGLPKGWRWDTLLNICSIFVDSAHRTPKYGDTGVPAIGPRDVVNGNLNLKDVRLVNEEEFKIQTKRHVPSAGDIVYSRELSFGWGAIIPENVQLCLSQGMCLFRASEEVNNRYLLFALNGPLGRKQAEDAATGSAHPHINLGDIKDYRFPIPPLDEQRRIVAEVERRLSVARQVESAVEAAQVRASRLRQAVLKSAFEGRLT